MKNKIVDFIMYNIILVAMILIVLMMLIPLPVIAVESLIGIETLFSIAILIYSFTKNRVAMPKLVLMFSLFSMALNISLTRISLTGYESGISVPLAGIISSTIGGKNYIIGGIISVILLTVQVFIISRGCCRVSEVNARFTLNSMNQKFFDIDNKLNQGIIDKREEEILKENVRKEIDYYSSMEGASKFLSGISKANVFFTLVNLAGGILIQVVKLKTSIGIAIENSMFITVGNTVLFTLPVMVVSFAAGLNITGDLKLVKVESEKSPSSEEMIRDLLSFLNTKTILSKKYKQSISEDEYREIEPQSFIYRIVFGDLLKSSGDILLCPVSADFKPSNPFSRKVIAAEGKWLDKKVKAIYQQTEKRTIYADTKLGFTVNESGYIGTEHVAFLPCKKLNYRGILFVSMDFYSRNREEINARRIAEAFEVAAKYNCKKISCPRNFLYDPNRHETGLYGLENELEKVIENVSPEIKIDFIVEYVIKKDLFSFNEFNNSIIYYDFSTALVEYLPVCSEILSHYRKYLKRIRTVYSLTNREARMIKKILTPNCMNKRNLFHAFTKLRKIMGDYYETGVGRCNEGFAFYLLGLCNEMPWMFNELLACIKEYYKKVEYKEGLDEFIFNERFRDLGKFNKRVLVRK